VKKHEPQTGSGTECHLCVRGLEHRMPPHSTPCAEPQGEKNDQALGRKNREDEGLRSRSQLRRGGVRLLIRFSHGRSAIECAIGSRGGAARSVCPRRPAISAGCVLDVSTVSDVGFWRNGARVELFSGGTRRVAGAALGS
jgi:hypothetical protein